MLMQHADDAPRPRKKPGDFFNYHTFDNEDLTLNRVGRMSDKQRHWLRSSIRFDVGCGVIMLLGSAGLGVLIASTAYGSIMPSELVIGLLSVLGVIVYVALPLLIRAGTRAYDAREGRVERIEGVCKRGFVRAGRVRTPAFVIDRRTFEAVWGVREHIRDGERCILYYAPVTRLALAVEYPDTVPVHDESTNEPS